LALNIKNEHVHTLARKAARRTGLTQTSVLERALEEFLARLDASDKPAERRDAERRARTDRILAEVDELLTDADRAAMGRTMEGMYDEQGLPAW
jgi:antitoxin VapB